MRNNVYLFVAFLLVTVLGPYVAKDLWLWGMFKHIEVPKPDLLVACWFTGLMKIFILFGIALVVGVILYGLWSLAKYVNPDNK